MAAAAAAAEKLSPSEERARSLFHTAGTACTPSDEIFATADGKVHETETPKVFVGATLADRFHVKKYIESGAFGMSCSCL